MTGSMESITHSDIVSTVTQRAASRFIRKCAIEDSQGYFYLAGYEIMVGLLKRAGYEPSDLPIKKLHEAMYSCRPSKLWLKMDDGKSLISK